VLKLVSPKAAVKGFILRFYEASSSLVVTEFNPYVEPDGTAMTGFVSFERGAAAPVVFEDREALFPLALQEASCWESDGGPWTHSHHGFRIVPFEGINYSQFVTKAELVKACIDNELEVKLNEKPQD